MTDARKVRPIAPLDAERMTNRGYSWWEVEQPTPPTSAVLRTRSFTDAEFAAAFMPAELFDAVLEAARGLIDEFIATGSARFAPLIEALDAYDAHRQTT